MTAFDPQRDTIFVTLAGSHAHGTSRADSDVDIRGVAVAPLAIRLSLFETFEQHEMPIDGALWERIQPLLPRLPDSSPARTECVLFDVAKFVSLCASANPNAFEILFADEADWLIETPAWRRIHAQRHRFLTRKVQQTYLGYAVAQLKRIETHRSWLLHPPARKPERADFGLPLTGTLNADDRNRIEQSLAERLRSYGIDTVEMPKATRIAVEDRLRRFHADALAASDEEIDARMRALASTALAIPKDVMTTLNAERRYLAAMKQWESFETWKERRNPARAALEARFGYDTKHAAHLVRLMRMGIEILENSDVAVRRTDAAELKAIRDGALSYPDLIRAAGELRERMVAVAAKTTLPDDVDRPAIDAIVRNSILPQPSDSRHREGAKRLQSSSS